MKHGDRKTFAETMAAVAELYGKELSAPLLAIYWQALLPYDISEVRGALSQHAVNPDTGQFMPKPADIVRFIEGNTLTQAMRAWHKVLAALRSVGTYESVVFDDALIHAVLADMGGWQQIGLVTDEDLPFRAREFEKRYQGYRIKAPATYPRKLLGILERENSVAGRPVVEPVLIGDAERARRVYEGGTAGLIVTQRLPGLLPLAQALEPAR